MPNYQGVTFIAIAPEPTSAVILNDGTRVVHKRKPGTDDLAAECGALRRVEARRLRTVDPEHADETEHVQWCGRCFERGGGY